MLVCLLVDYVNLSEIIEIIGGYLVRESNCFVMLILFCKLEFIIIRLVFIRTFLPLQSIFWDYLLEAKLSVSSLSVVLALHVNCSNKVPVVMVKTEDWYLHSTV